MLDYGWGNPSTMMLSGDEQLQEADQTRPVFDPSQQSFNDPQHLLQQQVVAGAFSANHHAIYNQTQNQTNQFYSFYDPRAYNGDSAYVNTNHPAAAAMFSLDQAGTGSGSYFVVPKSEEISRPLDFTSSRIGLNLGGRTYFSAADDDFVSRLYRRPRPGESGGGSSLSSPRCQVEGCNADLTHAKHYHRRHKVCEFHSKSSTVIAAGLTQRFCQQCSRFHLLSEFDNGKRSCRKRLADHNRRRRKSHQSTGLYSHKQQPESSSQYNTSRSPQDLGAQSSSSMTVPLSPPRISLDCLRQRPYQTTPSSSSASSNSLFFSSG